MKKLIDPEDLKVKKVRVLQVSLCAVECTFCVVDEHTRKPIRCSLGNGVSTMCVEGMKPTHCCPGVGHYDLSKGVITSEKE